MPCPTYNFHILETVHDTTQRRAQAVIVAGEDFESTGAEYLEANGSVDERKGIAHNSIAYREWLSICEGAVTDLQILTARRNTKMAFIEAWRSIYSGRKRGKRFFRGPAEPSQFQKANRPVRLFPQLLILLSNPLSSRPSCNTLFIPILRNRDPSHFLLRSLGELPELTTAPGRW